MPTLRTVIAEITEALKTAGVDNPRLDARILAGHVLGLESSQTFLRGDETLTDAQSRALGDMVARRAAREPVSRILGRREFWGLPFIVTPATLDPRADTETLVSAVLDHRDRTVTAPRILDLGTGTGCIALALLHEIPEATAVAVDASAAALNVARANAAALGLASRIGFARGNWAEGLAGPFDIIVSNPPYLSAGDMARLEPEVCFDPRAALDGGADGLAAYRAILADAPRIAAPGALAAVEVGQGQDAAVAELAVRAGLRVVEIRADLGGIARVVVAQI